MEHGKHIAGRTSFDADRPSAGLAKLVDSGGQAELETSAPDSANGRPYWLPDKLYDLLKWIGLLLLPALGLFIGTVGPLWGWPHVDELVATLDAIGILIACLIGASQVTPSAKIYFGIGK